MARPDRRRLPTVSLTIEIIPTRSKEAVEGRGGEVMYERLAYHPGEGVVFFVSYATETGISSS